MKNVKQFIILFLLFVSPLIAFYTGRAIWLLIDDRYKSIIHGNEIYRAIEKSKKKTKYKKLILGDSTANQFYNCKEKDPVFAYSLTCNQAIGMVGQYILLQNYLKAGNRPDTVYIIYTPISFKNNLDQVYTYHYFLKPFYYKENKQFMSKTVEKQIKKIPKYWLCHIPYIQTTGWAPEVKQQERHYTFLSPISNEYLSKIDILSDEYNFDWELIPTFVAQHWRDTVKSINREEYAHLKYRDKLSKYIEHIKYLDDSCFVDDIHLRTPQIYKNRIDSLLN